MLLREESFLGADIWLRLGAGTQEAWVREETMRKMFFFILFL